MYNWYLIRTKTGAERTAHEQLQHVVERALLPLAKTQIRQRDRTFQRISPIFPCYLFAFFSLGHSARQIRAFVTSCSLVSEPLPCRFG
jgi:hypothetical protein